MKQLISLLKSWAGRLIWRKRNVVLPTSNVSSNTTVTDSTDATSATTALAKKSPCPLRLGNDDAKKVESAPHIESAVISSSSTSAHVDTDSTFCAGLGDSVNAHSVQFHSHFLELDDSLSECKNCNQMKNHMKTLTKVAE